LAPFEKEDKLDPFSKLLIFNDVFFTVSDAIRLLETNQGVYDAACAMDFKELNFYDRW
jgi:hypothetical protein